MSHTITNGEAVAVSDSWQIIKPRGEYYAADDIINAYLMGGKEALGLTQQALVAFLVKNVDKTVSSRSDIYKHLDSCGFHPQRAYLKIIAWDTFEILITVPPEEFLDPEFLTMYEYAGKIEESVKHLLFRMYFSFAEETEELDEKQMYSDGFVLRYIQRKSSNGERAN
jgi:hypothetical protein